MKFRRQNTNIPPPASLPDGNMSVLSLPWSLGTIVSLFPVIRLLDQMMTRYSFYPYTHAAYMGISGSPESCEKLYPSCPSTAEEMIDLFNNIHRYYPDGIPFKENLPWPFNVLLP